MGVNVYRKDVESNKSSTWEANNKILPRGVIGHESDTNKIKIGNGILPWSNLPYISGESSVALSYFEIDVNGNLVPVEFIPVGNIISCFDVDDDGNLMPSSEVESDNLWKVDENGDLQPKEARE